MNTLEQERKERLFMEASSLLIHAQTFLEAVRIITQNSDTPNIEQWIKKEPYYTQAESEISAMAALAPDALRHLNGLWAGRNLVFEYTHGLSPYRAWREGLLSEEEKAS